MRKSKKDSMDRRKFLQGAAAGAAAIAAIPAVSDARQSDASRSATAQPMPKEPETGTPSEVEVLTEMRSGSDLMVDIIFFLSIGDTAEIPPFTFRGPLQF